jgi:hypothetical protein
MSREGGSMAVDFLYLILGAFSSSFPSLTRFLCSFELHIFSTETYKAFF